MITNDVIEIWDWRENWRLNLTESSFGCAEMSWNHFEACHCYSKEVLDSDWPMSYTFESCINRSWLSSLCKCIYENLDHEFQEWLCYSLIMVVCIPLTFPSRDKWKSPTAFAIRRNSSGWRSVVIIHVFFPTATITSSASITSIGSIATESICLENQPNDKYNKYSYKD